MQVLNMITILLLMAPALVHGTIKDKSIEDEIDEDFKILKESVFDNLSKIEEKKAIVPIAKSDRYQAPTQIRSSEVQQAYIPAGSKIYTLSHSAYLTTRNLYVFVKAKDAGSQIFFLIDKNQNTKYYAYFQSLVFLGQDLDIGIRPRYFKSSAPIVNYLADDPWLRLDTALIFHKEKINVRYFNDFFQTRDNNIALAERYEGRIFFPTNLGMDLGLSGNYEQGNWNSAPQRTDGRILWKAGFIGPMIRVPLMKTSISKIDSSLGLEQSIFFTTSRFQNIPHRFDATAVTLNLDANFRIWGSKFILGTTYRKERITNSYKDQIRNITSNRNSMISLSGHLGLGWDVAL